LDGVALAGMDGDLMGLVWRDRHCEVELGKFGIDLANSEKK
jgi:hypothetical protein